MCTILGQNISIVRPELITVPRKTKWLVQYESKPKTKCAICGGLFDRTRTVIVHGVKRQCCKECKGRVMR